MDIFSVLTLIGGIGLFLYGISLLGSSLEKIAGSGLEKTLEKLTNNKWKGLALGTVVTGIIQSSAATTIMLLGFVNAGIMKLSQTVPVMMGANIGTTVTGQILRLGDVNGTSSFFMQFLQPSSFAPLVIGIGAAIMLVSKKRKTKDVASLLIGFGILFFGMSTMEGALAPLKDSETFRHLFFLFENPFLGVLLGLVVTAILQSSSASVGLLQAISSTGAVTFSMVAPIVIGMNVGKCITVVLASIGTNKNAKRVVTCDLAMNIINACIYLIVIYTYQSLIGFSFWETPMTRGNIANFHTLFNVGTTVILFPFTRLLVKLAYRLIKDGEPSKIDKELALLDDIFLDRPVVALEQCKKVILSMGDAVKENYSIAVSLLHQHNTKQLEQLKENERFLDKCETQLSEYLVRVTARGISREHRELAKEIMHSVSDFERMGDHCINIVDVANYNREQHIAFSESAKKQLQYIEEAVSHVIDLTCEAFATDNSGIAYKIEPLEEVIDLLKETIKNDHILRLQDGVCHVQGGISYVELLTSFERISDHCSNIALHILQKTLGSTDFDTHEFTHELHNNHSIKYTELYNAFMYQYMTPLEKEIEATKNE